MKAQKARQGDGLPADRLLHPPAAGVPRVLRGAQARGQAATKLPLAAPESETGRLERSYTKAWRPLPDGWGEIGACPRYLYLGGRVAVAVEPVRAVVVQLHHARAQRLAGEVVQRVIGEAALPPRAGRRDEPAQPSCPGLDPGS